MIGMFKVVIFLFVVAGVDFKFEFLYFATCDRSFIIWRSVYHYFLTGQKEPVCYARVLFNKLDMMAHKICIFLKATV